MKPANVAVIGIGAWGKNLLRNFASLKGCTVTVGCDADAKNKATVANLSPAATFTTDFRQALDADSVEAVVIATPPDSHFAIARAALEVGKDVFVEKPLTLQVADGETLVRLAEQNKRILMVGHIMEYHPAVLKLKGYVTSGELGKIYYLYATRVNLGKVRDTENALWSFAPHDISLVLFLLEQKPVKVTANGAAYLKPRIPDVVFLSLQFAEGTLAHIHVSWLDPHKDRKLTVVGSRKMAVFNDTEASEKIWIYDKGVDTKLDYNTYAEFLSLRTGDITIPKVDGGEPLAVECQHFLDCVAKRVQPRSDGQDGLTVLRVLAAAQQSLDQGGTPVEVRYA